MSRYSDGHHGGTDGTNDIPGKNTDMLFGLSQPALDDICEHVRLAVSLSTDGGNFTWEEAREFVKAVVDELPRNWTGRGGRGGHE